MAFCILRTEQQTEYCLALTLTFYADDALDMAM
jgi:hypothetical protein